MAFRKKLTRSQMLTLLGNVSHCTVVKEAGVEARESGSWPPRRLVSPRCIAPE